MASYYSEVESSPEPESVDFEDMVLAAQKLSDVLAKAEIRHGYLGGFACRIIGSPRLTSDVDCCVEADWKKLREVLSTENGFQIPKKRLISGVMRIYACVNQKKVQIDIKQAGEGAGPTSLSERIMIIQGLPILVFTELIRAKLWAYYKRDGAWDGADILFLLRAANGKVDADRISTHKVEYFLENFEWQGHEGDREAVKQLRRASRAAKKARYQSSTSRSLPLDV